MSGGRRRNYATVSVGGRCLHDLGWSDAYADLERHRRGVRAIRAEIVPTTVPAVTTSFTRSTDDRRRRAQPFFDLSSGHPRGRRDGHCRVRVGPEQPQQKIPRVHPPREEYREQRAHEHAAHETPLGDDDFEGIRFIGTAREKAAVISFVLEGVHPHDIGTILDREGIAIRTGHHCAQPLLMRFNVPATGRASFGLFNTREEADALVAGLHKVIEVFR